MLWFTPMENRGPTPWHFLSNYTYRQANKQANMKYISGEA